MEISGSVTHDSSVQDCGEETPLSDLRQRVDDAEPELAEHLAHLLDDWASEIRVIKQGDPSQTWTYRLCPGQQSEVLAETLRAL